MWFVPLYMKITAAEALIASLSLKARSLRGSVKEDVVQS